MEGTGEFEVRQNDIVVVTGFIKIQSSDEQMQLSELKAYEVEQLSTADVYQDLTCKGYKYNKIFQGIQLASNNGILYFIIILKISQHCSLFAFRRKLWKNRFRRKLGSVPRIFAATALVET